MRSYTGVQLSAWFPGGIARIRSFVAAATKMEAGNQALLNLRHLPGMVSLFTAVLACGSSGNWANLKVLAVDPAVRDKYEGKPLPVLEATDPYEPFGNMGDIVPNTLARATITGRDVVDSMKDFNRTAEREVSNASGGVVAPRPAPDLL